MGPTRSLPIAVALAACTSTSAPAGDGSSDSGTDAGDEPTTSAPDDDDDNDDDDDDDPDDTGTDGAGTDVTYHADIRPLIERHCSACHSEGAIAPFPLTSYDEVFDLREAIATAVEQATMPPWGMNPDCSSFVGDSSVPTEEQETIRAWVDGGAPEGNPDDFVAPEAIPLPQLSRTDLTLELPEPYTPTQMPDEYRCFILDWPETEESFVTGFQFEADNVSIAHHAIAYIISPEQVDEYEQRDVDDPGPGYTCFGSPSGMGALDFIASRWLAAWAPGNRVGDLPEGTGLRIEPGSKIVLQMHYNTLASDGSPDQSRMHYKLDGSVEREAFMLPWADPGWLMGGMPIPAGSEDTMHEFSLDPTTIIDLLTDDAVPGNTPLEFFSTIHHMHRRGQRGYQSIERGDGTSECVLDVPRYDYDWQHSYRFSESKVLEPGDQLRLECAWDNADNDSDVNWGDGTGDEMCLGVFYIAPVGS